MSRPEELHAMHPNTYLKVEGDPASVRRVMDMRDELSTLQSENERLRAFITSVATWEWDYGCGCTMLGPAEAQRHLRSLARKTLGGDR